MFELFLILYVTYLVYTSYVLLRFQSPKLTIYILLVYLTLGVDTEFINQPQ